MKKIKFLVFVLFLSVLFLKNNSDVKAVLWSNVATDISLHALEQLEIEIRISANAAAKMFSIKQAQITIQSMLNNGSSSPKYITNYEQFLVENPYNEAEKSTQEYINNFLLRGQYDDNYVSIDAEINSEGININYKTYLGNVARSVLEGDESYIDTEDCPDLNNEEVRASGGIFYGGMKCFNSVMNNSNLLPVGAALKTRIYFQQELENNQIKAQIMAQTADGYLPVLDENGNIIVPAGTVEELQNKGVTISIDAIVNSDSAMFSNMVQAWANSTVSNLVNYGLGEVNRSSKKNYDSFNFEYKQQLGKALENSGPAVLFGGTFKTFWD